MFIYYKNVCNLFLTVKECSSYGLFSDSHLTQEDPVCDATGFIQAAGCPSAPV